MLGFRTVYNMEYFSQGKHLPDGSTTVVARELVYPNVNRHHAGVYMCAANNGYGQVRTVHIRHNDKLVTMTL